MSFEKELVRLRPFLKKFALSLCHNDSTADDLIQTTYEKALSHRASFESGTNLQGWLQTILRNTYFSEYRKHKREVSDPDGLIAGKTMVAPDQLEHVVLTDTLKHMGDLPLLWHQPLLLSLGGMSYNEMAKELGTAPGTMKSRLNRARARLKERTDHE